MESLSVALAILLPAIASALSQAWATTSAVQSMARQPEAANDIRGITFLALAFMEALTLFALVIAVLMLVL